MPWPFTTERKFSLKSLTLSSRSNSISSIASSIQSIEPSTSGNVKPDRTSLQKKAFIRWINSNLRSADIAISSLKDLRDGTVLLLLLKILTSNVSNAPPVPEPEKGNSTLKIHHILNVGKALKYIESTWGTLHNIGSEDIVGGDTKLTLGLIWIIILQYQISDIYYNDKSSEETSSKTPLEELVQTLDISLNNVNFEPALTLEPAESNDDDNDIQLTSSVKPVPNTSNVKQTLLSWCQQQLKAFIKNGDLPNVTNFSTSWQSGLAFCGLLAAYDPTLIDFQSIKTRTSDSTECMDNMNLAFQVAEERLDIPRLLDAEDMALVDPDEKSVMTYVSSYYVAMRRKDRDLPNTSQKTSTHENLLENASRLCDEISQQVRSGREILQNLMSHTPELADITSQHAFFTAESKTLNTKYDQIVAAYRPFSGSSDESFRPLHSKFDTLVAEIDDLNSVTSDINAKLAGFTAIASKTAELELIEEDFRDVASALNSLTLDSNVNENMAIENRLVMNVEKLRNVSNELAPDTSRNISERITLLNDLADQLKIGLSQNQVELYEKRIQEFVDDCGAAKAWIARAREEVSSRDYLNTDNADLQVWKDDTEKKIKQFEDFQMSELRSTFVDLEKKQHNTFYDRDVPQIWSSLQSSLVDLKTQVMLLAEKSLYFQKVASIEYSLDHMIRSLEHDPSIDVESLVEMRSDLSMIHKDITATEKEFESLLQDEEAGVSKCHLDLLSKYKATVVALINKNMELAFDALSEKLDDASSRITAITNTIKRIQPTAVNLLRYPELPPEFDNLMNRLTEIKEALNNYESTTLSSLSEEIDKFCADHEEVKLDMAKVDELKRGLEAVSKLFIDARGSYESSTTTMQQFAALASEFRNILQGLQDLQLATVDAVEEFDRPIEPSLASLQSQLDKLPSLFASIFDHDIPCVGSTYNLVQSQIHTITSNAAARKNAILSAREFTNYCNLADAVYDSMNKLSTALPGASHIDVIPTESEMSALLSSIETSQNILQDLDSEQLQPFFKLSSELLSNNSMISYSDQIIQKKKDIMDAFMNLHDTIESKSAEIEYSRKTTIVAGVVDGLLKHVKSAKNQLESTNDLTLLQQISDQALSIDIASQKIINDHSDLMARNSALETKVYSLEEDVNELKSLLKRGSLIKSFSFEVKSLLEWLKALEKSIPDYGSYNGFVMTQEQWSKLFSMQASLEADMADKEKVYRNLTYEGRKLDMSTEVNDLVTRWDQVRKLLVSSKSSMEKVGKVWESKVEFEKLKEAEAKLKNRVMVCLDHDTLMVLENAADKLRSSVSEMVQTTKQSSWQDNSEFTASLELLDGAVTQLFELIEQKKLQFQCDTLRDELLADADVISQKLQIVHLKCVDDTVKDLSECSAIESEINGIMESMKEVNHRASQPTFNDHPSTRSELSARLSELEKQSREVKESFESMKSKHVEDARVNQYLKDCDELESWMKSKLADLIPFEDALDAPNHQFSSSFLDDMVQSLNEVNDHFGVYHRIKSLSASYTKEVPRRKSLLESRQSNIDVQWQMLMARRQVLLKKIDAERIFDSSRKLALEIQNSGDQLLDRISGAKAGDLNIEAVNNWKNELKSMEEELVVAQNKCERMMTDAALDVKTISEMFKTPFDVIGKGLLAVSEKEDELKRHTNWLNVSSSIEELETEVKELFDDIKARLSTTDFAVINGDSNDEEVIKQIAGYYDSTSAKVKGLIQRQTSLCSSVEDEMEDRPTSDRLAIRSKLQVLNSDLSNLNNEVDRLKSVYQELCRMEELYQDLKKTEGTLKSIEQECALLSQNGAENTSELIIEIENNFNQSHVSLSSVYTIFRGLNQQTRLPQSLFESNKNHFEAMFSRVSSFSDHVKLMVSDIKHSFSKVNNVYSTLAEISEWVQKCTESERDMIQDLKTTKMHLMPIVEAEELLRDLSNSQKKLEKEFTDYQTKLNQVNSSIEAVDKLLSSSVTQPVHDMHKSVRTEFNELNDILKSRVNLKDLLRRIYNHNRAYQQIQDWLTVARSTILAVQITDRGLDDIETKLSTFTQTFQTFQNSSKELQSSPDISDDVTEYLKSRSDVISNDWGNLQNLITAVKQKIGTAVATIEIGKTVDELEKLVSVYRERVLSVRLVDSNDFQSSQESSISVLIGLEPTIANLYSRIEEAEKSVSQLDSDQNHLKNRLSHLKTLHSELIDLIRFRKRHIEETTKVMTALQFSEEITKLVESFMVILDGIYIDDVPLVEIDSTIQVVESRYQQFSSASSRLSELIEQTVKGIHNDPQVDAIREKIKHERAEVTELIQKKKQGLLERKRDILEFMEIQRKGASSMSMTSPSVSPSPTSTPHRSVSPALSVTNSIAVSSSVSATAAQRSMPSSLPRPKSRNRSKSQSSQTRQPNLTYPTSNYPPRRSVTPTPIPTQSISRSSTPLSAPAATNSDKIPRQRSKSVSSASPSFQNFSSNLMSPPQSPTPPLPSLPSFSYPTFSSTTSQSYHHHLHQSNQLPTPISLLSSPPLSIPTPDPSFDFTSTEYTFPSTTSPPPQPSSSDPTTFQLQFYNPTDPADPIDLHLSNLITSLGGVYFSIRKLSKGKYQFGKLDGKIVNLKMIREGVCLVRVGGGWKRLEEWVLEGRDFVGVGVKERSVLGLE